MAHAQQLPTHANMRSLWLALGLLVVIPALVFVFLVPSGGQADPAVQTFATGAGEQRSLRLEDGAEVRMQENTTITVRYSEQQRRVQLNQGEMTVIVAPDPVRPFWAQAGTLRLRADVSAFQLHLTRDNVQLQVLEGSVRAQSAGGVQTIKAGENIVLASNH